jgi:GTP cyclohydrolase I
MASFRDVLREWVPEEEWGSAVLDLDNTSDRVESMFREELLAGYRPGARDRLIDEFTTFNAAELRDPGMVAGKAEFSSVCAHHLQAFTGEAYFCTLPKHRIAGLSKIPRVVRHYASMLQVQERLGLQVVEFVADHLDPLAFLLVLRAEHHCMKLRGVRLHEPTTVTAHRCGIVEKDTNVQNEMYRLIDMVRKG